MAMPFHSNPAPSWRSIGVLLLLVVFLLIGFTTLDGRLRRLPPVIALDVGAAALCETLRDANWNATLRDLTALGAGSVVTVFAILACVAAAVKGRVLFALQIVLASGGAGIMSRMLKTAIERERPALLPPLADFSGFSFPSGHALLASALYLTLALIVRRSLPGAVGNAVLTAAVLIIIVVALSRVYLRVHFASDVVAGLMLGTCWALLLDRVLRALK